MQVDHIQTPTRRRSPRVTIVYENEVGTYFASQGNRSLLPGIKFHDTLGS